MVNGRILGLLMSNATCVHFLTITRHHYTISYQHIELYVTEDEFSVMQCIPTTYILNMRIFFEEKMERVSKSSSNLSPSSILSIVAGSLIIIGSVVPIGMLGMSGHYGMMSRFGTGETTGGWCGPMGGWCGPMGGGFGMMMPLQPSTWTAIPVISAISIGIGAVLIVGGYLIYRRPESAGKWGVAILVTSVVGLLNMSGFFIGPILGIIGGILGLTRR